MIPAHLPYPLPYQDFKEATLAFWLHRYPELEEITISLRTGGEVVGFVKFDSDGDSVEFSHDECHAALTGG